MNRFDAYLAKNDWRRFFTQDERRALKWLAEQLESPEECIVAIAAGYELKMWYEREQERLNERSEDNPGKAG